MSRKRESVGDVAARVELERERALVLFAVSRFLGDFVALNGQPAARQVHLRGNCRNVNRSLVSELKYEMNERGLAAEQEAQRLLARKVG